MKKHPVIYKEKEYEVRWDYKSYDPCSICLFIYEVEHIFFYKKYKPVYVRCEADIKEKVNIAEDDPTFCIEEIKELFKMYKIKRLQEETEI